MDSYAWIEYLIGSIKGETVRKLIFSEKNEFLTIECCLAEIKGWCLREGHDFNKFYQIIKANSQIVSINEHDWIESANERFTQRKKQKDFGLIDSIILTKQKELNCNLITGDKHFKSMNKVVFLES